MSEEVSGETPDENEALTDQEREDLISSDSTAHHITYSGQDFDVLGLVRRLGNEDIVIPSFGIDDERVESEGFQRAFVWRRPQMDKFIESLLLGYPIPGVFLVKQQRDNRYLVLDGQQRLMTLKYFFEGIYEKKEFSLRNVADEFKDLTFKSLSDDQRRAIENTFIQAIIVASDGSKKSLESIYNIFERLNSGGTQLTPHEIRVALYAGKFIGFLESLNTDENWRLLYGKKSPRLRDQELVLRIVGLYLDQSSYSRPLKKFLNYVAGENRDKGIEELSEINKAFTCAAELLLGATGIGGMRLGGKQVNAAFGEALMVGLMCRISGNRSAPEIKDLKVAVDNLRNNEEVVAASSQSTADEENVRRRLNASIASFGEI